MTRRYELRDNNNPTWRGQRFASLDRALREQAHAVPRSRWSIVDRTTRKVVSR